MNRIKQEQCVSSLCRTCLLEKDEDMEEIYGICNILKDFVPIQLEKKESWPNKICCDCVIQAKQAYQFRAMCIQSDKLLTERLSSQKTNNDPSFDFIDINNCNYFNFDTQSSESLVKEKEVVIKKECVREEEEEDDETCIIDDRSDVVELGNTKETQMDCSHPETNSSSLSSSSVARINGHISIVNDNNDALNVMNTSKQFHHHHHQTSLNSSSIARINGDLFIANDKSNEIETDPNLLECYYCDRKFERQSLMALKCHKQQHFTERKCHFCKKYCQTVPGYKNHVRTHKEIGSHRCEACGKCFSHSQCLTRHRRTHLYVTPNNFTVFTRVIQKPSSD